MSMKYSSWLCLQMKNGSMKDRQYPEITHTINDTNVTQPRSEQEGRLVLLESVTATATVDEAVFSQSVKHAARKSDSLSQDKL